MTTTTAPRTIAEIRDDIRRYTERLDINCVKASTHWYNETLAKRDAAYAELAAARKAGARTRGAADAAWLDTIQDIKPLLDARAGAR